MSGVTVLTLVPLGSTTMTVSRVGLGSWGMAGDTYPYGWGPQDRDEALATVAAAVELGVNWIDTAPVYGRGRAERLVGQVVAKIPAADRPYVFTKAGLSWETRSPADPAPQRVGDPQRLRREVEASLRRLQVERIDLYQMHWPPEDGTPLEEYWGVLLALRAEGKIRAAGLSNHDVRQLEAAEALGHVDTLQPPFSAIRRDAAPAIAWCHEHDTGVLVYSPLASGLLAKAPATDSSSPRLPAGDWRAGDPQFRGDAFRRNLAVAEAVGEIASARGVPRAAVAVAWTLAWPGVTGAIVGARRSEHVDDWGTAATMQLSRAELDHVTLAIERAGAGSGPVRPGSTTR